MSMYSFLSQRHLWHLLLSCINFLIEMVNSIVGALDAQYWYPIIFIRHRRSRDEQMSAEKIHWAEMTFNNYTGQIYRHTMLSGRSVINGYWYSGTCLSLTLVIVAGTTAELPFHFIQAIATHSKIGYK